jgi:glucokinase
LDQAISIDVGGTQIKWGLVSEAGEFLRKDQEATEAQAGPAAVGRQIADIARRVYDSSDRPAEILGIGVGCPGLINEARDINMFSPNLYNLDGTSWRDIPLVKHIKDALGDLDLPVRLENDVNAMVLGEFLYGAGRGVRDMIGMTLGTGVGGGLVLGGRLYRGAGSTAGEIGHMTVVPDGPMCGCGNFGCLEALVGKAGLIERALAAITAQGQSSSLETHLDELKALDDDAPLLIADAARQGDRVAQTVFADTGRYIGTVLGSLANLINPELAVIGGGISRAGDVLFPHIEREVRARAMKQPADTIRVVPAEHGNDAGMLGAAALILRPDAAGITGA